MSYEIRAQGESLSFPSGDPFIEGVSRPSTRGEITPEVLVLVGSSAGTLLETATASRVVLVELEHECLGVHTGEDAGREGGHVLGFARYRNGQDPPSNLIELVRQPGTSDDALSAGRSFFEDQGFDVAVCSDQAGRIIDRLVRPKYNAALRFLDEGLASAHAIDLTCRLGLSYPDGPIERVERGGLAEHHDVTRALFETYGSAGYAPARRAVVAAARRDRDRNGSR